MASISKRSWLFSEQQADSSHNSKFPIFAWRRRFLTAGLLWLSSSLLVAQTPQASRPDRASEPASTTKAADTQVVAIVGGDIHTITQGIVRDGVILIRDGKISEVGRNLTIPEGAQKIDATGKIITPGFISMTTSGLGLRARGNDSPEQFADTLDPFDRNFQFALSAGITTSCVQVSAGGGGRGRRGRNANPELPFVGIDPDEAGLLQEVPKMDLDYGESTALCPCCGLPYLPLEPIEETPQPSQPQQKHAVVKSSYGQLDGMLVKTSVFYDVQPNSLSGAFAQHQWRQQVKRARDYLKQLADHEEAIKAGRRQNPPQKTVTDELISLVKKEIAMRTSAESVNQIRELISLSKELDYRLVLDRGTEAWLMADELAAAQVPLIITPRNRRAPRFGAEETSGSYIEAPRIYEQTGVSFAVSALSGSVSMGGIAGRDLMSLPMEAMFAVRGGASEAKALEALTITPARLLGLEDRLGSIEVGKDADLLILDGPALDYRTYVETALVNGKRVYDRAEARVVPVFERK